METRFLYTCIRIRFNHFPYSFGGLLEIITFAFITFIKNFSVNLTVCLFESKQI
jgi:hypothetical protein